MSRWFSDVADRMIAEHFMQATHTMTTSTYEVDLLKVLEAVGIPANEKANVEVNQEMRLGTRILKVKVTRRATP